MNTEAIALIFMIFGNNLPCQIIQLITIHFVNRFDIEHS